MNGSFQVELLVRGIFNLALDKEQLHLISSAYEHKT